MPDKVRMARFCLLVAGVLKFATAGLFAFIFVSGSVLIGGGERAELLGNVLLGRTGASIAAAAAAAGLLDFAAAAGVGRRARWGQALGLFVGVVLVPLVPIGTVLGIFILSGLLGEDARAWFGR
ncbi:MAG TPA: hypothetical protein VMS75_09115 [Terriglobales bacterium]|nr:hypothetical protein [Terriglobales bacterium]